MILRKVAIAVAFAATGALWVGYGERRDFRGTAFWGTRYIVFASATFLGLSSPERELGWIGKRVACVKET